MFSTLRNRFTGSNTDYATVAEAEFNDNDHGTLTSQSPPLVSEPIVLSKPAVPPVITHQPESPILPLAHITAMIEQSKRLEHITVKKTAERLVTWLKRDADEGCLHDWPGYDVQVVKPDGNKANINPNATQRFKGLLEEFLPRDFLNKDESGGISFNLDDSVKRVASPPGSLLTPQEVIDLLAKSKKVGDTRLRAYAKSDASTFKKVMQLWASNGMMHFTVNPSVIRKFPFNITSMTVDAYQVIVAEEMPKELIQVKKKDNTDVTVTLLLDKLVTP